jgi:formate-dependent nitrite reductase cytochrome c552 subunit
VSTDLAIARIAVIALLATAGGCAAQPVPPQAERASWFPHARHLEYFASGRHRAEKIAMHVTIFGGGEAPEPVAQGRCAECHDDLASRTACATCHVPFQNAALRARGDKRPCIACHRGTWTGSGPATPSPETCLACHDPDRQPASGGPKLSRVALVSPQGPPVRIRTLPANVYFSHRAHVRFADVSCTRCHEQPGAAIDRASARPLMKMTECLRCHKENGAGTDCLVCHR